MPIFFLKYLRPLDQLSRLLQLLLQHGDSGSEKAPQGRKMAPQPGQLLLCGLHRFNFCCLHLYYLHCHHDVGRVRISLRYRGLYFDRKTKLIFPLLKIIFSPLSRHTDFLTPTVTFLSKCFPILHLFYHLTSPFLFSPFFPFFTFSPFFSWTFQIFPPKITWRGIFSSIKTPVTLLDFFWIKMVFQHLEVAILLCAIMMQIGTNCSYTFILTGRTGRYNVSHPTHPQADFTIGPLFSSSTKCYLWSISTTGVWEHVVFELIQLCNLVLHWR